MDCGARIYSYRRETGPVGIHGKKGRSHGTHLGTRGCCGWRCNQSPYIALAFDINHARVLIGVGFRCSLLSPVQMSWPFMAKIMIFCRYLEISQGSTLNQHRIITDPMSAHTCSPRAIPRNRRDQIAIGETSVLVIRTRLGRREDGRWMLLTVPAVSGKAWLS